MALEMRACWYISLRCLKKRAVSGPVTQSLMPRVMSSHPNSGSLCVKYTCQRMRARKARSWGARVEWKCLREETEHREEERKTHNHRVRRSERARGGELRRSPCTWQSSCGLLCCCCRGVAGRARRGNFTTLEPGVPLSHLRSSELPWVSRLDLRS